jgi:hypothetical protein
MVWGMRAPFRQTVRDRYQTLLEREAYRVTRRMVKAGIASGAPKLTLEVVGPRRQAAFMQVGWKPEVESPALDHRGQPMGHTTLKMVLDTPDLAW